MNINLERINLDEGKEYLMDKELLKEIEVIREEMVEKALKLGMSHPLVLRLSKRIDKLHMDLEKIKKRKRYVSEKKNSDNIYEYKYNINYTMSII